MHCGQAMSQLGPFFSPFNSEGHAGIHWSRCVVAAQAMQDGGMTPEEMISHGLLALSLRTLAAKDDGLRFACLLSSIGHPFNLAPYGFQSWSIK